MLYSITDVIEQKFHKHQKYIKLIQKIHHKYHTMKLGNNVIDFDDMLVYALYLTSTDEAVQIKLLALWVALMLTYLFGDVLRIFSGDFKAGEIGGKQITQELYFGIAILMVIPVVMVFQFN